MTTEIVNDNKEVNTAIRLLETAPGLRIVVFPDAPNFTIASISRDFCRLFDIQREAVIGKNFLDAYQEFVVSDGDRIKLLGDSLNYVMEHKTEHRTEELKLIMRSEAMPNKENFWRSLNTPVVNDAGNLDYIINTPQEKNPETESRLRHTFAIETVGVIYFDLDGAIHDANPAFERMSGYSREDFISGQVRWDVLTPPEFMEVTEKSRQEFLSTWKNTPYEKQYLRPDGTRWWGLFAGKRLSETECVEFVLDITLLKQVEEEIENRVNIRTHELACLNQELERSNKSLEEFAYAASHDLKEPIRKIQLFVDRLHKSLSNLGSEQHFMFERIFNSTKRMSSLIEDLLSYSHVNMHDHNIHEVNLNEIIQLVLTDLEVDIENKKAKITVENLFSIKGRPRQLQQVFHNLIGNSLKYSKEGIEPFIEIRCHELNSHEITHFNVPDNTDFYKISVIDNGIGFEQEYAEHIFSAFTRLHGKNDFNGTGIGLSIVRKVVENHKGFIRAESSPGEGSVFTILLPANQL